VDTPPSCVNKRGGARQQRLTTEGEEPLLKQGAARGVIKTPTKGVHPTNQGDTTHPVIGGDPSFWGENHHRQGGSPQNEGEDSLRERGLR